MALPTLQYPWAAWKNDWFVCTGHAGYVFCKEVTRVVDKQEYHLLLVSVRPKWSGISNVYRVYNDANIQETLTKFLAQPVDTPESRRPPYISSVTNCTGELNEEGYFPFLDEEEDLSC